MIDLNKLSKEVYENAKAHGFHDKEFSYEHCMMLVITELSEAVEAHRKGNRAKVDFYKDSRFEKWRSFEMYLKDTVEDELADAVIRILDYARCKCIDVVHGEGAKMTSSSDKQSFTESIYKIISYVQLFDISTVIASIFGLCASMNIDLEFFIKEKVKYNKNRPHLHGKKY